MSEPVHPAGSGRRGGRRRRVKAISGRDGGAAGLRALHLRMSVLPTAAMALLGQGMLIFLSLTSLPPATHNAALATAIMGAAVILVLTIRGAATATRQVEIRLDALRSLSAHGRHDLQNLVEQVKRGERFSRYEGERLARYETDPWLRADGDPFAELAAELRRGQLGAGNAVITVAQPAHGEDARQRLEVFVNIARRMQSLVHREISLLDELEAQVEDPDLLKGLFQVDHLATRMRRQSESLAVLGGAMSRRQWSGPVTMYEVLRSAVAEVEHYSRVRVAPPVQGRLVGGAVADIIHLTAELVENATKFSPDEVTIRAAAVPAGLAIEIDDRGLGLAPTERQRMNELLTDPGQISVGELLRDGRIGLFVVGALARRHGVMVRLQGNVYGGTQAVVVIPAKLLDPGSYGRGAADRRNTAPHRTMTGPTPVVRPMSVTGPTPVIAPSPVSVSACTGPVPVPVPVVAAGQDAGVPAGTGSAPVPDQGVPVAAAVPAAEAGAEPEAEARRPALPQRKAQQHLAPELRDRSPAARSDDQATADQPSGTPGLMAAFQSGFGRSGQDGGGDDGGGPYGSDGGPYGSDGAQNPG